MKKIKKSWLNGKTILITGVSSGIGRETCKNIIEKYGAKVVGIARREERLIELKTKFGDMFTYFCYDVTALNFIEKLNAFLQANNILIDIVFSNAGMIYPFKKTEETTFEETQKMFELNYFPFIKLLNNFLPQIEKSKGGFVVTCSASGIVGIPGMSTYSATKHAIDGTISAMRGEITNGTYLGAVYPGFVKTELFNKKDKKTFKSDELKFIYKFSISEEKAGKKIAKAIHKKKKRYVLGYDSKALNFFGKLMPNLLPKIITKVLKSSKLKSFDKL